MRHPLVTYITTTCAYSAAHSMAHLWRREDGVTRREMLTSDKVAYGLFATVYGFAFWPIFLHHDARRAELCLRGIYHDSRRHPLFGL